MDVYWLIQFIKMKATFKFFLIITVSFSSLNAQNLISEDNANNDLIKGIGLLNKDLFDQSIIFFDKILNNPNYYSDNQIFWAYYYKGKANLYSTASKTDDFKYFIQKYQPHPTTEKARLELADYYFSKNKYADANLVYSQINTVGFKESDQQKVIFRQGYGHFISKNFLTALRFFDQLKLTQGDFYFDANYYLGLAHFFEGNYNLSIPPLRIAENKKTYQPFIPYYLTQIYFARKEYQFLIDYAIPVIESSNIKNLAEIRQLLGQSFFELKDYINALPHLEYYAQEKRNLKEEEFYQLGFVQYQNRQFDKAIISFTELSNTKSILGQNAMFYLADCHLKQGDKISARTALAQVKKEPYDLDIAEEATFNYAKLSYELNDPGEAIAALQSLSEKSSFYPESRKLLGTIFLNTRDYQKAIQTLKSIPNKDKELLETYQKVLVFRGIQLILSNDYSYAEKLFLESLDYPISNYAKTIANFWLGELNYKSAQYAKSSNYLNQFLAGSKSERNLPEEVNSISAHYILGYNFLKNNDYKSALTQFKESIQQIEKLGNPLKWREVLADAVIKSGDASFKLNQYDPALKFYEQAIQRKQGDFVYAIFQKATIEGLKGRNNERIASLKNLADNYPNSPYAPEALYYLGATLQESGNLADAVAPLRKLVFDYKGRTILTNQGLLRLGLITYNLGKLDASIEYYKQVFENNPEPEEIALVLSALEEIYVYDLGRPNEYFAFLDKIPGYSVDGTKKDSINFRTAEIRFENANYNEAVKAFTYYIQNYPNGTYILRALYLRAESLSLLKKYGESLIDFDQIVKKGPSRYYQESLEKAALIAYNYSKDFNSSFLYYTQLESLATNSTKLFEYQLGAMQSAYRAKNTEGAIQYAQKIVNHPSATNPQKAFSNYYLGKISFDRGIYSDALRYLETVRTISDNEETAEARFLIAQIYYEMKDFTKAREICINANKESSAYPYWVAKSVLLLADVLLKQNEIYNSRAALEALLENYNGDQELIQIAKEKLQQVNQLIENSSRINNNPGSFLLESENEN